MCFRFARVAVYLSCALTVGSVQAQQPSGAGLTADGLVPTDHPRRVASVEVRKPEPAPTSLGIAPHVRPGEGADGGFGLRGVNRGFGTNTQQAAFVNFDLSAPGVLNTIVNYPDLAFAGDFGPDGNVYILRGDNVLERVDKLGNRTVIATVTPPTGEAWTGMALHPLTDVMYVASANCGVDGALSRINLNTGATQFVGRFLNASCTIAIAIDGGGRCWGYDILSDELYEIDLQTGVASVVGPIGFNANFGQGMSWDPETDELLMAAFSSDTFMGELRSVDRQTGATSLIGTLGAGTQQLGFLAIEAPRLRKLFASEGVGRTFEAINIETPEQRFEIAGMPLSFAGDFWVDGRIYYFNETTGTFDQITKDGVIQTIAPASPRPGESWTGMAVHPGTGAMYATASQCGIRSTLYRINVTTGAVVPISEISNNTCLISLAIDEFGNAYGHDILSDELIQVDLSSGAGTVIGSIGFNANFAQGLGYDQQTGQFYMTAFNNDTFNGELRLVDVTTGNTTLLGTLGDVADTVQYTFAAIENDLVCPGDVDGDGDVDLSDLSILLAFFGVNCP